MKLVELLVKELEEWPEGVTYFVQDCDREVKAGSGSEPREPEDSGVWIRRTSLDNYNFYSGLCTDWQTSIVTKDIYTKHKEEAQMKQDLCNTKIRIESEEHSKVFQEAVFAAGGKWLSGVSWFNHTSERFLYVNDNLILDWGTSESFFETHEYKEIYLTIIPAKGHVHAELMVQYADDAKSYAEPWKLWQIKGDDGVWWDCNTHPRWMNTLEYRRKPNTKLIHGVEVPVFEFAPKVGEKYYAANVSLPEFFDQWRRQSEDCTFTQRMIERGLLYPYTEVGKQAAILHAKAMLGVL